MMIRGLCATGIAAILFAVGCVQQPKTTPPANPSSVVEPQPVQQSSPAANVDQMEAARGSPDVLAVRAENYSRQIESMLSKRDVAQGPAVASKVQWADPGDFRLGDATPTARSEPVDPGAPSPIRAAIQTSPSQANRVAAISQREASAVTASANMPARADEPSTRPSSARMPASAGATGQLADRLSARIREFPRDVCTHLEYQLLQLLLEEQVPQLSVLSSLPTEDRELISAVLDGLSLFRSTLRSDNNMLLSKKIRPLIDMSDRLRSQADLTIPTVALCRTVKGFGDYEPIEPARFVAGSEQKAILYCEIANFSSNLNDAHQWETQLRQELVLYTEFGVPVWSDKTDLIKDAARTRRHDFFVNKRIIIPKNLTVGRYLLKASIVDLQANRVAEASVPIVVAAE